jgi:hypothetical protein
VWIQTQNGYKYSQEVSTSQFNVTAVFNVPQNQGSSVMVCMRTAGITAALIGPQNCQTWLINKEAGTYTIAMDSP